MALPSEAPEIKDFSNITADLGNSACIDMQGVSIPNPKQSPTKVILEIVNRRGRSRASLPDGTVLIASSRQPFLDAARVLVAAGYDPGWWVEGWRAGGAAFALRGRLGIAARLTVDETRTVFAPWKAFSSSAVASSIRHSEEAAAHLAAIASALLQPPLEKPSEITPLIADSGVAGPTAPTTTDRLLRPVKVD